MAIRVSDALGRGELRFEPTEKRIRALRGGDTVLDTTSALVVWEPDHVVPLYAAPEADLRDGVPTDALRRWPDDELAGYVGLDWDAFDRWLVEEEEAVGHPRDPFHRVDIHPGSRHVRVERRGRLLAESRRPTLLFETGLPTRHYLPREDVDLELLRASDRRTTCAYKGHASYWSLAVDGDRVVPDLVWTYEEPLPGAEAIRGLLCFFAERTEITVDGQPMGRPVTEWS